MTRNQKVAIALVVGLILGFLATVITKQAGVIKVIAVAGGAVAVIAALIAALIARLRGRGQEKQQEENPDQSQ